MHLILTAAVLAASQTTQSAVGAIEPSAPLESAFFWGDFDGDGLPDAYVVSAGPTRLLHNLGDGRFADVTDRAGLGLPGTAGRAHQARWADYDGDGRLDLFLSVLAGTSQLLKQSATGTFEPVTERAGLPLTAATGARWLDYDADGLPDLSVLSAKSEALYHNLGDGMFEQVDLGVLPRPLRANVAGAAAAAIAGGQLAAGLSGGGLATGDTLGLAASGRGSGTQTGPAEPFCAPSVQDAVSGQCLQASSIPTEGMLYPLGNEFFIDASGYVGLSTLTPGAKLDVVGGDIRTDRRLVSTAGSGAPLVVTSSGLVTNLNADQLDGFDASDFSMLGNTIESGELAANAVQSIHVFPNTLTSLDLASGAVLSDEIGDGTVLDVDINPLAAIQGTKIDASFGTQTVTSIGDLAQPAVKGTGAFGPTDGYLGVQGTTDFDGIPEADWAGEEIGVALR